MELEGKRFQRLILPLNVEYRSGSELHTSETEGRNSQEGFSFCRFGVSSKKRLYSQHVRSGQVQLDGTSYRSFHVVELKLYRPNQKKEAP